MKIFITLVCLLSSLPLAAQPRYVVVNLGLGGGAATGSIALAINNSGQVAGRSTAGSTDLHSWRTAANAPINPATDLIPFIPGTTAARALGINNLGQVTGFMYDSNAGIGSRRAFRFDSDGTGTHDLGVLPGMDKSAGSAINDSGQVVGASQINALPCTGVNYSAGAAFRTSANSPISPADNLGSFLGACGNSSGIGINNVGDVVGTSFAGSTANPEGHAFFKASGGAMQDLGVLGVSAGATGLQIQSAANSINSSGQIVGSSTYNHSSNIPLDKIHAILTTAAGPMQDLGTLGGTNSFANKINSLGQIVGRSTLADETVLHGFLYTGGQMYDLTNLIANTGWEITGAIDINDIGQIAGVATLAGISYAVRLDPADVSVSILQTQVVNLGLPNGTQTSLLSKLQDAIAAIQIGDFSTAIGDLGAFINEVSAQTGKKISPSDASALIATANAILAGL